MILHAPLALLVGLFAMSIAMTTPEVGIDIDIDDVPASMLTFAAVR